MGYLNESPNPIHYFRGLGSDRRCHLLRAVQTQLYGLGDIYDSTVGDRYVCDIVHPISGWVEGGEVMRLFLSLLAFSYLLSPAQVVRYYGAGGELCNLHFIKLEGAYNYLETWCDGEWVDTVWLAPTRTRLESHYTPRIVWLDYSWVQADSSSKILRRTVYLPVVRSSNFLSGGAR